MPAILGRLHENRQPLLRGVITNNVPAIFGGEPETPAAQRRSPIIALVDTGATNSVIDASIQRELALLSQNMKQVLFPNMASPEHYPAYPCEIFLNETFQADSRLHPWPDLVDMLALDLSGRAFQAVIGMDMIRQGDLTIQKSGAVAFKF